MFELLKSDGFIGLVGALVGAIVGGGIAWYSTHRFEKRRAALELYALFSSPEMARVRHAAGRILKENLASEVPLSFYDMHNSRKYLRSLSDVVQMINFWERTEILLANEYVDTEFVRKSLEHYFRSHFASHLNHFCTLSEAKDAGTYLEWTKQIRALARRWGITS